jgi:hypothetical protein
MTTLNDKTIRAAIKGMLATQGSKPRRVIDELHVHNSNAIVDIAAIYKTIHGFEIKGESDKVSRTFKQAQFYELTIPRLTLVTTINHIEWAVQNLEPHWGIILAKPDESRNIHFKYVRAAKTNKRLSKEIALLTLWKSELIEIASNFGKINISSKTRKDLTQIISDNLTKNATLEIIATKLANRNVAKLF